MDAEALFINHMDGLYRIAFYMLGCRQDAEDAVQETYVRLLMKTPAFHDEEHGKAWLIRVCMNLCKNQLRFRSRHPTCRLEEQILGFSAYAQFETLDMLTGLPPKLKQVVVLSALEGYSLKEISRILNISEEAAKKRLQRGREKLAVQLGGGQ